LLILSHSATAAPYIPKSEDVVLEKLPYKLGDSSARELLTLRRANEREPQNAGIATDLASRYFELTLEYGDQRLVGHADAVLQKIASPLPARTLLMRGKLRQYQHRFEEGLQDFNSALKVDPQLAEAYSWRAAIFMVLAKYPEAKQECAGLERLQRETMALGCHGLLKAYTGNLTGATRDLEQSLRQSSDLDNQLWLRTRLAEVAAWQGKTEVAERHYRAALALGKPSAYLLAARADFLLDAGRASEVVKLLSTWQSVDGLLLRLTLAEQQLGSPHFIVHLQDLTDRFAASRARGETTHQAEESRYYRTLQSDPVTALRLATQNFRTQREPRDARMVLEAALALSDPLAAEPVRLWMLKSGFQDVTLNRLAAKLFSDSTFADKP
jgi:tetratricopeptide (TPR) repeat protein